MHQMVRPQTRTPTASAAIQEPFHRSMTRRVWLVVSGVDGSQPVFTWVVQPDASTATAPATSTTKPPRHARRCLSSECKGGLPRLEPGVGHPPGDAYLGSGATLSWRSRR